MSLEIKAEELAEAIRNTEEFQTLKSAEAQLKLDPKAMDMLEEVQALQQRAMMTQQSGQQIGQDIISDLQNLEQQMQLNLTIKNVMEKRATFENVMQSVNEKISQKLSE